MARMRKVARRLGSANARAAARRVIVSCDADYFTVEPQQVFGRDAPLELEIGAGRGDFVIARATAMPESDFLAVELAASVAQLMAVRAGRRGLTNLRILRMDARPLVNLMLPRHTLSACHIYFPDPWPKERHVKHRLFSPGFIDGLARVLKPGAALYIATDISAYAKTIFSMLAASGFTQAQIAAPGATETGYARKFVAQGRPVFGGAFSAPG
jgi:tRNA (guanine-N7-)-methyltransferase